MRLPDGFEMASGAAGIKPSGKSDLALLYSPVPLHWAFASTRNRLIAPCVQRNRARYASGEPVRAVVVNAGNANCATGDRGTWDNEDMAGMSASALALARPQDVLTASTGVIGRRLPTERIEAALPDLVQSMRSDSNGFEDAILTTDLRTKKVARTLRSGARVVGIAKGSGMIHPDMATMLAFVVTDAAVGQDELRAMWPGLIDRSFNQVTVDGDTSPNDMALLLSSARADADLDELRDALGAVTTQLAQMIARDGEGATTLITVRASHARDDAEARRAARAVARSSLVKAAVHGRDPNWGRILSAAGQTGVRIDLAHVRIALQGIDVFRGEPLPVDLERISRAMHDVEEVVIEIDLAAGDGEGTAWGCDLSADYVSINADYTT